MDSTTAQGWIDNPEALRQYLSGMAAPKDTRIPWGRSPGVGEEFILQYVPCCSPHEIWHPKDEISSASITLHGELDPKQGTRRVKIIDLGFKIRNIKDARERAREHGPGYELLSADWSIAFRSLFPVPGNFIVAFGGPHQWWTHCARPQHDRYYLQIFPSGLAGVPIWDEAFVTPDNIEDHHYYWPASPLSP